MKLEITVPSEALGSRLDKFLGTISEIQSRSRAIQLLESGAVKLGGKIPKPSLILKGGEILHIDLPEAVPTQLQPMSLDLEILFEDQYLIVLNKPPGIVVHPAAGHAQDTLVNALIAHAPDFAMKFGEHRPGIVHRLDKDTSGIMVVAKNDFVQEALARQFKERTILRFYRAIVCGDLKAKSGTIKSFLARHPTDRKRFASVRDSSKKIIRELSENPGIGKWAHTDYEVIGRHPSGFSYLRLKLHTGRTHQIRIHLSEMGFPILGDETYGGLSKTKKVPRLALHAAELGFEHPMTKEAMTFSRDWPKDYASLVQDLFGGAQ
jgi:23S rRNA pseudouridine1911/1915/1917 synthase